MTMSCLMEYLELPGRTRMPIVGFGTWNLKGDDVKRCVGVALDKGYRHIDTALSYENEDAIGEELAEKFKSGSVKREDIFLVTKLPGIYMGDRKSVRKGFDLSLSRLRTEYVDLYLMHSPCGVKNAEDGRTCFPKDDKGNIMFEHKDIIETWKAMEELVDEGRVKAIGVSNFNSKQIQRIYDIARYPIANNQVECHVYFPQVALREFCAERGITLTAFAPLGSPAVTSKGNGESDGFVKILDDPAVHAIARKHNKTEAQVLLRFLLQQKVCVVPKSQNNERIEENIQIFDFKLDSEDMSSMMKLGERPQRYFLLKSFSAQTEYPFNEPF